MDIKNEISTIYGHYQNQNYSEAITASEKLIPEVNREIQGILFFVEANCYLELKNYQEAYNNCKKAAERGNADATAHLPQLESLLELRS